MGNEDFFKNISSQLPPVPSIDGRAIVYVASLNEFNKQIVTEQFESESIKAHRIKDLEIPYFDKNEKSKSTWVTLYVYVNVENGNVVNVKIK